MFLSRLFVASLALVLMVVPVAAFPVITEIMYHPAGAPEPVAEEWIELHNPNQNRAFDLSGWKVVKGVDFTFPAGTSLEPGAYLVVAANVATFRAKYPAVQNVVGGWGGRLSNSGETIELEDAGGEKAFEVRYADEGEWAVRARGPLHFSHRGWIWVAEHDGTGKSLEMRSTALAFTRSGQNWESSATVNGTPGAPNSVASDDVAPLLLEVQHRPQIPNSGESIRVFAQVANEPGSDVTVTLHWRVAGTATFQSAAMSDADADGQWEAIIPAQANNAVIEYYLAATDSGGNARTFPAPARTSFPGVTPETYAQATNALFQVDNSYSAATRWTPGAHPIHRIIMTPAERAELAQIGSTSGQQDSDAEMNATFISVDGTGVETRYFCGVRNRGNQSRLGPPNNYHVSFPSNRPWNDLTSMQLNCRFPHSQALGAALFTRAGIAPQEATIVQVRVNGTNLAETGSRMYGRYVQIESLGKDWVERHYPNDSDGNLYRLDDHEPNAIGTPPGDLGSGEFRYEGTNPAAYADTYYKETNKDEADYSDLITLTEKLTSTPDAQYPSVIPEYLDLDHFYAYFATDALIGNQEGGLQTGRADDASIYAGIVDRRFRLIPHDLDDVFDIGAEAGNPITRSIFAYDTNGGGLQGLTKLFNHPQLVPRYYAKVLEAMDTWFNPAGVDPIIDDLLGGWVPASDATSTPPNTSIAQIKAFVVARRANVLAQIQQNYSLNVATTAADTVEGYRQTTTGAATFSGTFNVAKTYSITVNDVLAQHFYRTSGTDAAGTWKLIVPAGGGAVLRTGLNKVTVNFHDAPGGGGKIIHTLRADVLYTSAAGPTAVSGTLAPGGLRMMAPVSYLPGQPFLVRVDQLNGSGEVDRAAWNTTVAISATGLGTVGSVYLYNGMGSALVTLGGGGGQPSETLIARGAASIWSYLDDGSNQGTAWRAKDFPAESTWKTGGAELGVGDGGETTVLLRNGTTPWVTYYFRKHFTVPNPVPAYAAVKIRMRYDDGAIVYLNGQRVVLTAGMTAEMPFNQPSAANRGAPLEDAYEEFTLPLSLLVPGDNTLAVEVHNTTTTGDISFDLDLIASYASPDPGNVTLSASAAGLTAQRAITSLGSSPTMTPASGTLTGNTTWSGVINVTGDVTVPAGTTLTIAPGTQVLVAGTTTPGDTTGADIIVLGALNAAGTAAQPIHITSVDPTARWGQIYFNGAQPSTMTWCLVTRGGHAPGQGHTGRGPLIRLNSASLTLDDCALGDSPAKALYSSGTCDLTMRRTLMARMITGPEVGDGIQLLIDDSNIQEILPLYRESNAAAPDDEDCLYVHNGAGRPVVVRRSVFARCGDDVFDCLGGPITVEDSILREGWDKGMSLLNNDLTITRTLIIDCDKAIVPKSSTATTRTTTVDRCTIVCEDHDTTLAPWGYTVPPSDADPDTPSTGLYTQNKSGQSNTSAVIAINAKNTIIIAKEPVLVDGPYSPANTVVTYSDTLDTDTAGAPPWPGTGNIAANPAFVNAAAKNVNLTLGSPARDTGDPASSLDPDGTRADMGALPYSGGPVQPGEIRWTTAGSPYRVTANTTVPAGLTLRIDPGVSVFFDQNRRLTVNGRIIAQGTAGAHITFSHVPGTIATGDADPIKNLVQTGPSKWGGVRVVDSLSQENVFRYCDFINAQGTDPATDENWGSLGFIRSWGWADHCTWSGTHLRMCYGRNSKLTVTHCDFPDMFLFDPALGRVEVPADFLATADNRMEPLKVEYPTTDTQVAGNPNYPNGLPANGHWRVYDNDFHGNRGHQDVFDADSGRWGQPGQFVLDCRYNTFHGLTGDEHIDLGGDAYIAHNRFYSGSKDQWTIDTGYANAISSGDKGVGTSIMVARNVFYDLDHAINLKINTATIFEHNTCVDFHQDWQYNHTVSQFVACSAVNLYVPNDGAAAGDGGYLGYNIFFGNVPAPDDPSPEPPGGFPRLFSWADQTIGGAKQSVIQIDHNFIDPAILDTAIGVNHPGGIFASAWGKGNVQGNPMFVNKAARDFGLASASPAKGAAPGGLDYGATVGEWAYIIGGPPSLTPSTSASFTIGGPGIVAYKWRLDGGAWSAPIQIGSGGVFLRTGPTVRQATLQFRDLANGAHHLEVLGQDMAGNWQDADPARTVQAVPTARSWTVNSTLQLIRINEILAASATQPDTIELYNAGAGPVDLSGYRLTDDPLTPNQYTFPSGVSIPAGGYVTVTSLNLNSEGDAVFLYNGVTLVDSVVFGAQIPDLTIGRIGNDGAWTLTQPTLGAPNLAQRLGDPAAVRINEWFAAGGVLYENDWIELSNPGALPVAIGGLRLSDNVIGSPAQHTIAPLSFIGAGGYVKFIADRSTAPGYVNFSLDAQREQIALLGPQGTIDLVHFGPQTSDFSQGRDVNGAVAFYELPTRGLANGTADPAYANALALLRGLRITEIMFNPSGGSDFEFIELRNIGGVAFDLGGVKFVEGIAFTFPAMVLQPGENVVLVANLAQFRSRYGSAAKVGGVYSGRLDNSGEKLALQLPAPFDANILTFAFSDTWQLPTRGFGRSLVIANPLASASLWGEDEAWQASASDGGDPDGVMIAEPDRLAEWLVYHAVSGALSDQDTDGMLALLEFALGRDPSNASGGDGAGGSPSVTLSADGRLELQIQLPENRFASPRHGRSDVTYTVQASSDLVLWTNIATKVADVPWSGPGSVSVGTAANGFVPVTVRDIVTNPLPATRYLRLRVTHAP